MKRLLLLTAIYVFIPGGLGLALWLVTDEDSTSFVSGLLFALLAISLESRFELDRQLTDVFSAIGLSRNIAAKGEIEDLVSSYDSLLAGGTEFERELVTDLVLECAAGVRSLRSGGCTIPGDQVYRRSIELVKAAKTSVFATSVVDNPEFWSTGPGQEYWETCRQAVQRKPRGIELTRVFMPRNVHEIDDQAKALIRGQKDAGVDVWIVFTEELERRNLHRLIADFAIFDDQCALELKFPPGERAPVVCGNYCSQVHQHFGDLRRIRDDLLLEAQSVDGYI